MLRHPCECQDAPNYPRLIKPTLFVNSEKVNKVYGGEVVDITLLRMAKLAGESEEYKALLQCMLEGRDPMYMIRSHPVRLFGPLFDRLAVEDTAAGQIAQLRPSSSLAEPDIVSHIIQPLRLTL